MKFLRLYDIIIANISENVKHLFYTFSRKAGGFVKKYFSEYINSLLELMSDDTADLETIKKELLVKIGFMQHERLVHLIVTVLFALIMFMNLILFFQSQLAAFLLIVLICLVLLGFYIAHYFFLENGVQQLYGIYDKICSAVSSKNNP